MSDNEHLIHSPLLLRVDTHIARFAGYSQSSETTPAVRLTLMSTTFGGPRFACETFSPEKGNARESAEACAK